MCTLVETISCFIHVNAQYALHNRKRHFTYINFRVTGIDEGNFYNGNGHSGISLGKFTLAISATLILQNIRLPCLVELGRKIFHMGFLSYSLSAESSICQCLSG